ncbi:toll/interleukin-1 receptor domain-containing protein [Sandarakinorhabdus sp. DWP1-3-1]|uniref:toll/interleukin-1 receptor domain-containing protein n=1 Tax=Sandarakinorhabdus sp. DWP1-3-1 TaxID=2804627 RepID=UPI003CEEC22D
MATGFISYTHADAEFKNRLLGHLAPLRREGLIEVWHDGLLRPGEHLDPAIQSALSASQIVILLISSDFIASEYCYEQELIRAFARQRDGRAQVVPIILRPCQWKGVPVGSDARLADFIALPKDGKPVSTWSDVDAAFDDAVGRLRDMIRNSNLSQKDSATRKAAISDQALERLPSASSNLSLASSPTDLDRDRLLRKGFAATMSVFEKRLKELAESNLRLESEFDLIDSRSMSARVYLDGKRVGEVSIWHGNGSWRNALCLSYDTNNSSRNTMNDWLSLETGDEGLCFSTHGSLSYEVQRRQLDADGAADYLWAKFLDQIRSRMP